MDIDPAASPEVPAPDWDGHGPCGRAERRLAGLEHLAGVGIRLAEAFAEQAATAANTAWITPDSHVDPGIPFAGMVRLVRQTMALQVRFEKADRMAAAADCTRRDPDRRARHIKRRRLIKDAVTEAIKDTADPSDAERLFRDLEERLHDEEADERFDDGPVGRVVAKICKALGVSIDLGLFEDEGAPADNFDSAPYGRPVDRAEPPHSTITRPPGAKPPGHDLPTGHRDRSIVPREPGPRDGNPGRDRAGPNQARPNQAGPDRAGPNRAGPD